MAQKPNNLPIIIIILVAIGGLVGLNLMSQKNDPVIQEKIAKEAQSEQQKKDMEAAKNAPSPPAPQAPGANEVATWGAEKTFGRPNGMPMVTIGWSWTPAIQGDPSSVYNALDAIQKGLPNAAIRVVNLDAKPGAIAPGVSINGSVRVQPLADGTFPPASAILPAISQPAPASSASAK